MEEDEWRKNLADPDIKIMMDNDVWWFARKSDDSEWFGGGNGPYGYDLLKFMLKEAGIEMESV